MLCCQGNGGPHRSPRSLRDGPPQSGAEPTCPSRGADQPPRNSSRRHLPPDWRAGNGRALNKVGKQINCRTRRLYNNKLCTYWKICSHVTGNSRSPVVCASSTGPVRLHASTRPRSLHIPTWIRLTCYISFFLVTFLNLALIEH